jgi:hypothetical protein
LAVVLNHDEGTEPDAVSFTGMQWIDCTRIAAAKTMKPGDVIETPDG